MELDEQGVGAGEGEGMRACEMAGAERTTGEGGGGEGSCALLLARREHSDRPIL